MKAITASEVGKWFHIGSGFFVHSGVLKRFLAAQVGLKLNVYPEMTLNS